MERITGNEPGRRGIPSPLPASEVTVVQVAPPGARQFFPKSAATTFAYPAYLR
ncbi:hypothetical protein ACF05W_36290 [Streptomyces lydicus]|uniref:hypothetical protein n=1 Tax=Streptomyces lydicus TaxID=47763 RepID=UPI0036F4BB09